MTFFPRDPPAWFNCLPMFESQPNRRVVIVDNQALSYYVLDGIRDHDLDFVFEDRRVIAQIGRQVIDEALHSTGVVDSGIELDQRRRPEQIGPKILGPGLPGELNEKMWRGVTLLQARQQLLLSGLTQMTAEQRARYETLATVIERMSGRGMREKDAHVASDALLRKTPIFSLDNNFYRAYHRALGEKPLQRCLAEYQLTEFANNLFVR